VNQVGRAGNYQFYGAFDARRQLVRYLLVGRVIVLGREDERGRSNL